MVFNANLRHFMASSFFGGGSKITLKNNLYIKEKTTTLYINNIKKSTGLDFNFINTNYIFLTKIPFTPLHMHYMTTSILLLIYQSDFSNTYYMQTSTAFHLNNIHKSTALHMHHIDISTLYMWNNKITLHIQNISTNSRCYHCVAIYRGDYIT